MVYGKLSLKIKMYLVLLCIILGSLLGINISNFSKNKNMQINIFGKDICYSEGLILEKNNNKYIHYDLLKEYVDDTLYYDSIANKVISTYNNNYIKTKINESQYEKNFENIETNETLIIKEKGMYILTEALEKWYGLSVILNENKMCIIKDKYIETNIKTDNVFVNEKPNCKSYILGKLSKDERIEIVIDEQNIEKIEKTLRDDNSKDFIQIAISNKYIGYVPRNKVNITMEDIDDTLFKLQADNDTEESKDIVGVYSDINESKALEINSDKVNMVYVNMFDIVQSNGEISIRDINDDWLGKLKKYDIYAIVTNGFNSVNFNKNTLSQLLSSEQGKGLVIKNILREVEEKNLNGVIIDFKNVLKEDNENLLQFIREITSVFNLNNKEVIFNISVSNYINYLKVIDSANYTIITTYDIRDVKSLTSGSTGEFLKIKECVNNIIDKDGKNSEKIILGLPLFSILWVEKNSIIIESKTYNINAIESYLLENNLEIKFDEESGQNYAQMKKGSLIYKMWLEDGTSMKNKLKFTKDNNLKGIALYKIGYDNQNVWDLVDSCFVN